MKIAFCGALILASSSVWATPASKPWQPWIAAHQSLVSATVGDLNKDGMPDVVLVIEDNKPENRVANPELGADQLNLNPRHLLVLVKTNNGYQL